MSTPKHEQETIYERQTYCILKSYSVLIPHQKLQLFFVSLIFKILFSQLNIFQLWINIRNNNLHLWIQNLWQSIYQKPGQHNYKEKNASGICEKNALKSHQSRVDNLDIFYGVTVTEEIHCWPKLTAGKKRIKGYKNTSKTFCPSQWHKQTVLCLFEGRHLE